MPEFKKFRGRWNRIRTRESMLRRRIWQRLHNPSGQTLPVFLIGCGRSGTSMIVRYLSRSRRLELYNEDHPAAFQKWRLREPHIIESLLERSYAPVILFKPILDTHKSQLLLSTFPKAKAIFVFRHYDDVINSSLKRFGTSNRLNHVTAWMNEDFSEFASLPPPEKTREFIRSHWQTSLSPESGAALYWLFYNRLFFDLHLDQHERVHLMQYESIVANPEDEFKELCRFLDLPFEPQVAKGVFASSVKRDPSPPIDPQIRAACETLWQCLQQHLTVP